VNHAEEAAFWYLRLNGFFAITNFVVHASREVFHTSDCDVLAVRLPFVYEEIGGSEDDRMKRERKMHAGVRGLQQGTFSSPSA
jgi:hypothetical protein